jgi:DNA-binding MarR family transcriptional regulator
VNFLQKVLTGQAQVAEIDDYVEQWHHSSSKLSLHEFLGLSPEEYAKWIEDPNSIEKVVAKRRESHGEKLTDFILSSQRDFLLNLSNDLSRGNISFSQFYLLSYLSTSSELTVTDIARKMGHSAAAAASLVERLGTLGYIKRDHPANDRRKVVVTITDKGGELLAKLRSALKVRVDEAMEETDVASLRRHGGQRQTQFHELVSVLWKLEVGRS